MKNKNIYSPREVQVRIASIKRIVSAAYTAKGFVITEDQKKEFAGHWERMLHTVPTKSLDELYELGTSRHCVTVEQFLMLWDMKQQAEATEREVLRLQEEAKKPKQEFPIPEHIIKKWKLREKGLVSS